MRRITRGALGVVTVVLALVMFASVAPARGINTRLVVWPGYAAGWEKAIGLPDSKGRADQGMNIAKEDQLVGEGFAEVILHGVSGATLSELGFSRRNDGVCGEWLFYRAVTQDDQILNFPCSAGLSTPIEHAGRVDEWSQVTFVPPAGIVLKRLSLKLAMPAGLSGAAVVDNFNVNGTVIGKP